MNKDNNIANLVAVLEAPNPAVVGVIERMLELAKAGEIQQVAIVADTAEEITFGIAYQNPARLIMGVEELKLRILGFEPAQ